MRGAGWNEINGVTTERAGNSFAWPDPGVSCCNEWLPTVSLHGKKTGLKHAHKGELDQTCDRSEWTISGSRPLI